MRKILFGFVAIVLFITLTGCPKMESYVPVSAVKINHITTTRAVGTSFQLTTTVLPADASNKSVAWTSSHPARATVGADGTVNVLTAGDCTITATTEDGSITATCDITIVSGTFFESPGWGASLGTASFHSAKTWEIGGQIWSDVVVASACDKTSFVGGTSPNFRPDGRRNGTGYNGHLFSWVAVVRHQDQLCPPPWRVPTSDDFFNLDIALGGNGATRVDTETRNKYLSSLWGGVYGGLCSADNTMGNQGSIAYYWSQSQSTGTNGNALIFNMTPGDIYPRGTYNKGAGMLLRCVQ